MTALWRSKLTWIAIIALTVLFIFIAFQVGSYFPNKDIVDKLVTPYKEQIAEQEETIKAKEEALKLSEAKYQYIVKKLKEKASQIESIKEPTTDKEMRDRYEKAGFKPIPIK